MNLDRLAYHEDEAAKRQEWMDRKSADRAVAARFGRSIHELLSIGPVGLRQMAREISDFDHKLRLVEAAVAIGPAWVAARHLDLDGQAGEAVAVRRRALTKAINSNDCPDCGSPFEPGERGYERCFRCSQVSWAQGSLACVMCGRRHSMKFGACFSCKQEKLEDEATFRRQLINRRDSYTCQMCGASSGDVDQQSNVDSTEIVDDLYDQEDKVAALSGQLEVSRILPGAQGGVADQWNLETLCTGCILLKGNRYGPPDDAARLRLMERYMIDLWEYLLPDERQRLQRDHVWALTESDSYGHGDLPVGLRVYGYPHHGVTDDASGAMNALDTFPGYVLERPERLHAQVLPGLSKTDGHWVHDVTGAVYDKLAPCKGDAWSSNGKQPCSNKAFVQISSYCLEGCA